MTPQQIVGAVALGFMLLPLAVLLWAFFSKGHETGGEPLE